jgi:hypothetical protein
MDKEGKGAKTQVSEHSPASLASGLSSLGKDDLDYVASVFECIKANLTPEERSTFGVELLDAVRNDTSEFSHVLGAWIVTSTIRTHPDYARQTKEFDNLVSSGELWDGVDREALHTAE